MLTRNSFFDAWRSGNYAAAIENLHRYFDYTMEAHLMGNGIQTHHQYALLHLAVLHADFGCYAEAISAMNECISTARENQDARCLHFSLSWLSHLRKAFPGLSELEHGGLGADLSSNEADTIHFLQQKATEPGQRDVPAFSGSLLAETELTLRTGGSVTKAIESSYQAGHLNRQTPCPPTAAVAETSGAGRRVRNPDAGTRSPDPPRQALHRLRPDRGADIRG
ncbi:APC5 protein [Zalaria obscura]|uniref:APC5 protein n=1 Tax=Zalaria obscura TaxID=2024903 RepID=A0ACC3S947_9PEZI